MKVRREPLVFPASYFGEVKVNVPFDGELKEIKGTYILLKDGYKRPGFHFFLYHVERGMILAEYTPIPINEQNRTPIKVFQYYDSSELVLVGSRNP